MRKYDLKRIMDYPGCFVCITPVYKGGVLLCALALYLMIYQKSHCHIIFSVMTFEVFFLFSKARSPNFL